MAWSDGARQYSKTDEEQDDDWVEGGFHLARVKHDENGEGGGEAVGCEIIIDPISVIQEEQFIFCKQFPTFL